MWEFLCDEQIEPAISRGILRLYPGLDIVTVQQAGLISLPDEEILAWAAQQNRVLLSKDRATMYDFAASRIEQSLTMPGLLLIRRFTSHGEVVRAVQLFIECSLPEELDNRILYIPI